MPNAYYDPGAGRARRVGDLFNGIARRYDRLNAFQSLGLHGRWQERLVACTRIGPGQRALDVCCGTGDVALRLTRTGADVVGLDFSSAMLEVARARLSRFAGPRPAAVRFVEGDALNLPFPADTFDAVTVAYGLRNLADLRRGLGEMVRVAKPGGRVVALDFGKPSNRLWRRFFFAYLRHVVPRLGRWVAGNAEAYAYIIESLAHYPAQAELSQILGDLGLTDIRVENLLGGAMSIHCAQKPAPTAPRGDPRPPERDAR
jgi:demethylmenaquinone methyltransferase/2-methoxy-6-polyprenyl-1,4-benzoquinol methylase